MSGPLDDLIAEAHKKSQKPGRLRLTRIRVASQIVFFALFMLAVWATWTTRLEGYPVSRLLEIDPLVTLSTWLSTGYVYRYLGWALLLVAITFIFGRVFCNRMFSRTLTGLSWLPACSNSQRIVSTNISRCSI